MPSGDIGNDLELQRKNENKDGKWCIITVFRTFGTFMSRLVGAHPSPPLCLQFLLHFWVLNIFNFLEKGVGPGLQGLYVTTPVGICGFG